MKRVKSKKLIKKTLAEKILYSIVFIVFVFFAGSYLYCLLWCFMSGFKTHNEVILTPFALPTKLQFSNYSKGLALMDVNGSNFFDMLFNSIYFSVFGAFLNVMSTAMIAYVTTKYRFKGSQIFFYASLIMMILPIYGSGGSQYRLMWDLGLVNSRWMILTAVGGLGGYYMYFNAFYKNLSWTYAEAAQIDGAGHFRTFFQIMFPQSMSMFGAVFLLSWIAEWNNYGTAIIYLSEMPTLASGIYIFELKMDYLARIDILYAASSLTLIVPLLIFIFFNKILMSNISLGGIKE
jgi:ABC-type glycerol-3-phosphate transport system permease component